MANHNHFRVTALAAAIAAASAVMPSYGYEYVKDDFSIQVDTEVSVGAAWRADDRDYRSVGKSNAEAATHENPNGYYHATSSQDNGNLLYKKGSTYSEVIKAVVDVEMNYKNYGAFIRGKAFYDNRLVNGDGVTDKPAFYGQDANGAPLEPHQSAGRSADILDAFVWGNWWLDDMPLNVRLGKQVINWGEGVFFANGINTINPIDVNALLTPGSEIKDALLPQNALYASLGINESLTLEGFVLLEWGNTELQECGTFFATTDTIGTGCGQGFYSSGLDPNAESAVTPTLSLPADYFNLPVGDDIEADDGGQFGLALRYFADAIETEFGFYYINYHSRLPVVSGYMPKPSELTYLAGLGLNFPDDNLVDARNTITGTFQYPIFDSLLLPSAQLVREYPEDIQLFGVSFNTTFDLGLPGGATSVSGEVSMRKDQPFMYEDSDLIAALLGLPSLVCSEDPNYDCYSLLEAGDYMKGYVEKDYYQAEVSFIHFFDRVLGASRWTVVLDIAGSYLDLPSKSEAVLNSGYNATLNHPWLPDTNTGVFVNHPIAGPGIYPTNFPDLVNSLYAATGNNTFAPEDDYYPTSGAWGYKLRFAGEYSNVFAGVNLKPVINFSHDVSGTTPSPISNFVENRKALNLSLEAEYEHSYSVQVSYTDFYGAEPYNQLADRDFYSISASASF